MQTGGGREYTDQVKKDTYLIIMLPELDTWKLSRKYMIKIINSHIKIIKTLSSSWYFKDTTRLEAINLLMDSENPLGTFLVRPSESSAGECALSVKILIDNTPTPTVNHYKIKTVKDNGVTYYYIGDGIKYPSINQLIEQYSSE